MGTDFYGGGVSVKNLSHDELKLCVWKPSNVWLVGQSV